MKLTPMADRVLLKPTEAEETTASGIILSTANKEKPVISEVVAVGPGDKDTEMVVKAGDKVVVGKYTGTESSWTAWTTPLSSSLISWRL